MSNKHHPDRLTPVQSAQGFIRHWINQGFLKEPPPEHRERFLLNLALEAIRYDRRRQWDIEQRDVRNERRRAKRIAEAQSKGTC